MCSKVYCIYISPRINTQTLTLFQFIVSPHETQETVGNLENELKTYIFFNKGIYKKIEINAFVQVAQVIDILEPGG